MSSGAKHNIIKQEIQPNQCLSQDAIMADIRNQVCPSLLDFWTLRLKSEVCATYPEMLPVDDGSCAWQMVLALI